MARAAGIQRLCCLFHVGILREPIRKGDGRFCVQRDRRRGFYPGSGELGY